MSSNSPIRQLVYGSSTPTLFTPDELADILRVSRRNNAASGVTGVLLYTGGNVMQVLEGPPDAVEAVYDRVAADARHRRILILLDRSVETRSFPDWSMGVVRADAMPPDVGGEVRSFYEMTEPGPDLAHRLLSSFRALAPEARQFRTA